MSLNELFSDKTYQKVLNREAYGPDTVIFKEGERGNDAYLVLRGEVEIVTKTADGKFKKLRSISEGEMFGEMSLLNNEKRSAHAITKDGCELLLISQSVLRDKLETADPVVKYWIEFLSERVLDLSKRIS